MAFLQQAGNPSRNGDEADRAPSCRNNLSTIPRFCAQSPGYRNLAAQTMTKAAQALGVRPGLVPAISQLGAAVRSRPLAQGLVEILDQVGRVLEPNREAQEVRVDAEVEALGLGEALVGRGGRMRDQRLGVPQVVRDADQAQAVQHLEGARL